MSLSQLVQYERKFDQIIVKRLLFCSLQFYKWLLTLEQASTRPGDRELPEQQLNGTYGKYIPTRI